MLQDLSCLETEASSYWPVEKVVFAAFEQCEEPASNTDELSDLNPFTNPEKLPECCHFQHKTKRDLATSMDVTLGNLNKLESRTQNKTQRM